MQANLADFSDNQWITSFQESAEAMLGIKADDLGNLRESVSALFHIYSVSFICSFYFILQLIDFIAMEKTTQEIFDKIFFFLISE